jgi:hypothetical protein
MKTIKNAILNLMSKQRGFVPILVIILIILVVSGYSLYQKQYKTASTKQSFQTESLKTYDGSKIFTLQYPSNWYVWINPLNEVDCPQFSDIPDPNGPLTKEYIKGHSLVGVCFSHDPLGDVNKSSMGNIFKEYNLNTYRGFKGIDTKYGLNGSREIIYLENPTGGYVDIILESGDPKNFDRILQTFRFTNSQ